ncbi:MAG: hypothetical protein M0Q29_09865 [Thiopseudomonas sp.]|nr:hypothetical protein [Thiopseudomonas sp.]
MPIIIVDESFKFAIGGNEVVEYCPGAHEVSDRCAHVAVNDLKVAAYADDNDDVSLDAYEPDTELEPEPERKAPQKRKTANRE